MAWLYSYLWFSATFWCFENLFLFGKIILSGDISRIWPGYLRRPGPARPRFEISLSRPGPARPGLKFCLVGPARPGPETGPGRAAGPKCSPLMYINLKFNHSEQQCIARLRLVTTTVSYPMGYDLSVCLFA